VFGSSLNQVIERLVRPRVPFGRVLEVGPGRAWPGLQLLRANPDLDLVGWGYDEAERKAALAQAKAWGVANRAEYLPQPSLPLLLDDRSVEAVISFGGLALWPQPLDTLNELARVLKVEGDFFLGAPRRDLPGWQKWLAGRGPAQEAGVDTDRARRLIFQSRLEQGVAEVRGPDVWLLRKAHA
jgi:SAM-dependent methyltransferase